MDFGFCLEHIPKAYNLLFSFILWAANAAKGAINEDAQSITKALSLLHRMCRQQYSPTLSAVNKQRLSKSITLFNHVCV